MGNQPTYIAHSRPSRRAYREMVRYAEITGAAVDPRWTEFGHFLADLGRRPENTVLRRRDETQGFYPSNCRWEHVPAAPEPSR